MIYEILDDAGNVINTIIADENFVQKKHPNRYRVYVDPDLKEEEASLPLDPATDPLNEERN